MMYESSGFSRGVTLGEKSFNALEADEQSIQALARAGIPHIWHGTSDDGTGMILATRVEYRSKDRPKERTFITHAIMK